MRLLVSHQPPASNFCQLYAHSLLLFLMHVIKMVLLCITVIDTSLRRALLPWEIVESHSETYSICEFFSSVLVPMLSGPSTTTKVPTVSFN